jgi:hypothetical protein
MPSGSASPRCRGVATRTPKVTVWAGPRPVQCPAKYRCDDLFRPEFHSADLFLSLRRNRSCRDLRILSSAWFGRPWTTNRVSHRRGPRFDPLCVHQNELMKNQRLT